MIGMSRKTQNIPCTVEIAQTPDSLKAYVVLEGMDPGPGDKVIVHGAPTRIGFRHVAQLHLLGIGHAHHRC